MPFPIRPAKPSALPLPVESGGGGEGGGGEGGGGGGGGGAAMWLIKPKLEWSLIPGSAVHLSALLSDTPPK